LDKRGTASLIGLTKNIFLGDSQDVGFPKGMARLDG
jgi:hypothetical protein